MLNVDSYDAKIVAVLHDVLEDDPDHYEYHVNVIEDLFGREILNVITTLTKVDGFSYKDYIDLICENQLARYVKQSDIRHNLATIDPTNTKKIQQYKDALETIMLSSIRLGEVTPQ